MTAGERFERVERLYHLALEKEPGERAEFLRDACGDDESILKDVQSLLAREEHAHDFLEEPALEVAAEALAHEPPSLVGRRLGPYDILGLIGAIVGGWLSSILLGVDLTSGFNLTTLVVSVIGAVVVVAIYRLVTRRSLT